MILLTHRKKFVLRGDCEGNPKFGFTRRLLRLYIYRNLTQEAGNALVTLESGVFMDGSDHLLFGDSHALFTVI
ncbi:hypothetical protein EVAR_51952_1 [Eumeta japonica]|uniref:Uncharacterized protein n=1 Tax=Eumeta variegata TaxID=151549 RepID=A0A4C1Y5G5_EUMVA|nr:hypothetical protein EVAR_51952_1 [Eumeta japonica]